MHCVAVGDKGINPEEHDFSGAEASAVGNAGAVSAEQVKTVRSRAGVLQMEWRGKKLTILFRAYLRF